MADSLVLKGVKDVRKHTGTEMQLVIPRRGGNTHQIRQWWRNGVNTPYCACTLVRVTTANGVVYLALETGSSERATVKITHDGDFNFTFSHISQLKRAALYDQDRKIIEHYAFPAIVNGPIVKTIPPGAVGRPNGTATIDTVTVSGSTDAVVGEEKTYTVAYTNTGEVGTVSYQWATAGGTMLGDTTDTVRVTFNRAGANTIVACTVSSDEDGVEDAEGAVTVNVAAAPTSITGVTVAGKAAPDENEVVTYSATVTGDATPYTYTWNVVNGAVTAGDGTASATVTWGSAGAGSVRCTVGSDNDDFDGVTDNAEDLLNVTVQVPAPPSGPAASLALVGTTSIQGDGNSIMHPTDATSGSGSGLTVYYDVTAGECTGIRINNAGNGYEVGDTFEVRLDTGVTGRIDSIATVLVANNAQADVAHVVTVANGVYEIDGVAQAEVTANAGETIYFDLSDASLATHPFKIYTNSSKTTLVTVGVESDANGLIFTPPISGTFSYQCASHAGMGGTITIS